MMMAVPHQTLMRSFEILNCLMRSAMPPSVLLSSLSMAVLKLVPLIARKFPWWKLSRNCRLLALPTAHHCSTTLITHLPLHSYILDQVLDPSARSQWQHQQEASCQTLQASLHLHILLQARPSLCRTTTPLLRRCFPLHLSTTTLSAPPPPAQPLQSRSSPRCWQVVWPPSMGLMGW